MPARNLLVFLILFLIMQKDTMLVASIPTRVPPLTSPRMRGKSNCSSPPELTGCWLGFAVCGEVAFLWVSIAKGASKPSQVLLDIAVVLSAVVLLVGVLS